MNGYLLLLDQEKSRAINGKKPDMAKMARRPTSQSAPTQPGEYWYKNSQSGLQSLQK